MNAYDSLMSRCNAVSAADRPALGVRCVSSFVRWNWVGRLGDIIIRGEAASDV
jgi:hypothetical protein